MIYTIKKGDTLSGIAQTYGTTVETLVHINNIQDPDKIYAGDTITVPGLGVPSLPTLWEKIKKVFSK